MKLYIQKSQIAFKTPKLTFQWFPLSSFGLHLTYAFMFTINILICLFSVIQETSKHILRITIVCGSLYNIMIKSSVTGDKWVVYEQLKLISHSSGGWELQGQGTSTFSVWWQPTSWFTDGYLLTVSYMVEGARELGSLS